MTTGSQISTGILMPLLVFGLFMLAAILRIKKSSEALQNSQLPKTKRLLNKLDIALSIPFLLMAVLAIVLALWSLR